MRKGELGTRHAAGGHVVAVALQVLRSGSIASQAESQIVQHILKRRDERTPFLAREAIEKLINISFTSQFLTLRSHDRMLACHV